MVTPLEKVSKLSQRIIRVLGHNPGIMTLQGTNTYLIGTGPRRILLDTSEPDLSEYRNCLKQVVKENGFVIDRIVVTHWHHDHVGGVKDLLSELEPKPMVFKMKHDSDSSEIEYSYLKDGDQIQTEGATLRVMHTPGHTTDHICLYLKEEQAIFSGDCILGEGTTVFEDLYTYMKSLEAIQALSPDIIYPGHGPVIENPTNKIAAYIKHRQIREAQILECLKAAKGDYMTVMEIVVKVYVEIGPEKHRAAASNVIHHLSKLVKEGKVLERERSEGYVNVEQEYAFKQ